MKSTIFSAVFIISISSAMASGATSTSYWPTPSAFDPEVEMTVSKAMSLRSIEKKLFQDCKELEVPRGVFAVAVEDIAFWTRDDRAMASGICVFERKSKR